MSESSESTWKCGLCGHEALVGSQGGHDCVGRRIQFAVLAERKRLAEIIRVVTYKPHPVSAERMVKLLVEIAAALEEDG